MEAARAQQGQIGWPSDQEYYKIIRDNLLTNSKATLDDLRRAEHIYGATAVDLLKGKTVYKPVNTSASIKRIPLPPIVLKAHPSDDLDVDFIYVQDAPYLLMKSTKVKSTQLKLLITSAHARRKHSVLRTNEDPKTS